MMIMNHERDAASAAIKQFPEDIQKAFWKAYNTEYKRIWDEAVAEDAKRMVEDGVYK